MAGETMPMGSIPGASATPGTPDIQQLVQQLLQQRMAQVGGPSGSPGVVSPGRVGQPAATPRPPFMGQGPQLPGMSQQSQSGSPGAMPAPMNQTAMGVTGPRPFVGAQGGPYEFATKSGRNAATVNNAINSLSQMMNQSKQQQWTRKAGQAEQAWGTYIALSQAIDQATDPKQKQALQQQLQQMTQDPKFQKVLDKAHQDPTTPEGVGLQRAMQMSKTQAEQQLKMDQLRAQIQTEQAKQQQEQATAQARQAEAEKYRAQIGQATIDADGRVKGWNVQTGTYDKDLGAVTKQETLTQVEGDYVKQAVKNGVPFVDALTSLYKAKNVGKPQQESGSYIPLNDDPKNPNRITGAWNPKSGIVVKNPMAGSAKPSADPLAGANAKAEQAYAQASTYMAEGSAKSQTALVGLFGDAIGAKSAKELETRLGEGKLKQLFSSDIYSRAAEGKLSSDEMQRMVDAIGMKTLHQQAIPTVTVDNEGNVKIQGGSPR